MGRLMLTFDDGPDPVWTPRLLDLLSAAGARATFFPIAPRAAAHPEVIGRAVAEGHEVGLHCDVHERHSQHSRDWGRRDAARALERLARIGVRPGLWRTPWGDTAPWSAQVAAGYGLRLVAWTVDTHDWRGDTATQMFATTGGQLNDGAVVLAHDGIGPGARRATAAETLAYVERVVEHASAHRLELAPIP